VSRPEHLIDLLLFKVIGDVFMRIAETRLCLETRGLGIAEAQQISAFRSLKRTIISD
jgi:hypothetical protein